MTSTVSKRTPYIGLSAERPSQRVSQDKKGRHRRGRARSLHAGRSRLPGERTQRVKTMSCGLRRPGLTQHC
jgi:hypothetical protein